MEKPPGPPEMPPKPWWESGLSAGGWVLGMLVLLLVAYDQFKPKPPPPEPKADAKQRFQNGPYVALSKPLSSTEELSIVIVPSPIGSSFDVRCLLYKNRQFSQALFSCPDDMQLMFGDPTPAR